MSRGMAGGEADSLLTREPDAELNPKIPGLCELKADALNCLSHPGTPVYSFKKKMN